MSQSILDQIGNTPLVALKRVPAEGSAAVLGKLESRNPTGSVKDRIALAMVRDAEEAGTLLPGHTLGGGHQRQHGNIPGYGRRGQGVLPHHRYA